MLCEREKVFIMADFDTGTHKHEGDDSELVIANPVGDTEAVAEQPWR